MEGSNQGHEGPEDEGEVARRAAEDQALHEQQAAAQVEVEREVQFLREIAKLAVVMGDGEWQDADDSALLEELDPWDVLRKAHEQLTVKRHQDAFAAARLRDDETFDGEDHEEAADGAPSGAFINTATLAATHQFLATLSGPEGSRAQALRAQLPAVPE